jgi:hypothetical protein
MRTAVVLVVRLTASRRTVFDGVGEPAGSGRALRPGERCPEFAGTDGAGRAESLQFGPARVEAYGRSDVVEPDFTDVRPDPAPKEGNYAGSGSPCRNENPE